MGIEKVIQFTPEMVLPVDAVPVRVPVKGRLPRLEYSCAMKDIYPVVPSLNPQRAYHQIVNEFTQTASLLLDRIPGVGKAEWPQAESDVQAQQFLAVLFDSARHHGYDPQKGLLLSTERPGELFRLKESRPFAFRSASPAKIAHTMAWIDTNIKVAVEDVAAVYQLSVEAVRRVVESVFRIYSLVVKQQDFFLARMMNINYSMFIQDRILSLTFGSIALIGGGSSGMGAARANDMALQLLKGLHGLSYSQLCTLSVFMGVMWVSSSEMQRCYRAGPDNVLGDIESQLNSLVAKWGINHIDRFLREVAGIEKPAGIAVILDDNGESVFDVALFQRLLDDVPNLRVGFVVNEYPVSNNMALDTFRTLLQDSYFATLRGHLNHGRATLHIESQMFRSFEVEYLRPSTQVLLADSVFAYVKGANFFETFQPTGNVRYYCFTVHGWTSMLLTGCPEDTGIFACVEKGRTGYTYDSPEHVVTLLEKVARDKEGVNVGN